jgi:hypothetical protein
MLTALDHLILTSRIRTDDAFHLRIGHPDVTEVMLESRIKCGV